MEDQDLKAIWKAYDNKLEKLLLLNLHTFEQLQKQKANSKLRGLAITKILGIILGAAWVLFLGTLAFYAAINMYLFFAVSVGAIILITIIAMIAYVKDIVLINQVNNDGNIIGVQGKLAMLQSSAIKTVRISVLQLPFYTTFFISKHMLMTSNIFQLALTFGITGLSIVVAIWLYSNITYKNIHKKWLKVLMGGSGLKPVVKAMEFLNEIEEYKKDGNKVG